MDLEQQISDLQDKVNSMHNCDPATCCDAVRTLTKNLDEAQQKLIDANTSAIEVLAMSVTALQTQLSSINSCTCNEMQVKQTIEALRLRIEALEEKISSALCGEIAGGVLNLKKLEDVENE